jgi:hypothetical protein
MLTHLHLKSSSSPGQTNLNFPIVTSMTIFFGPNNSGESLLLRDNRWRLLHRITRSHTHRHHGSTAWCH